MKRCIAAGVKGVWVWLDQQLKAAPLPAQWRVTEGIKSVKTVKHAPTQTIMQTRTQKNTNIYIYMYMYIDAVGE